MPFRVHLRVVACVCFVAVVASLSATVAVIMIRHSEKQADDCEDTSLQNANAVNLAGRLAVEDAVKLVQERTNVAISSSVTDYFQAAYGPVEFFRRRFAAGALDLNSPEGTNRVLAALWDGIKALPRLRWLYLTTFPNGEWLAYERIPVAEGACAEWLNSVSLNASFCGELRNERFNILMHDECCAPATRGSPQYHYAPVDVETGRWGGSIKDANGVDRWDWNITAAFGNDAITGNGPAADNGTACCGYTSLHTDVQGPVPLEDHVAWREPFLWTNQFLVGWNAPLYTGDGMYIGVVSAEFALVDLGLYIRSLRKRGSSEEFFLLDAAGEEFLASSCVSEGGSNRCGLTPDPAPHYLGARQTSPDVWVPISFYEVADIQGGLARELQNMVWEWLPTSGEEWPVSNCSWCGPGPHGRSWAKFYADNPPSQGGVTATKGASRQFSFQSKPHIAYASSLRLGDVYDQGVGASKQDYLKMVTVSIVWEEEYMQRIDEATAKARNTTALLNSRMQVDLDEATEQAIIFIVCLGTVILVLTFAGVYLTSAPLRVLSANMHAAAVMSLEEIVDQSDSVFLEISELQVSFRGMIGNLREFRRFIPETLMVAEAVDDASLSTSLKQVDAVSVDADSPRRRRTINPLQAGRRGSPTVSEQDSDRFTAANKGSAFSVGEFKAKRGTIMLTQYKVVDDIADAVQSVHSYVAATLDLCKMMKGVAVAVANYDGCINVLVGWNAHKPRADHAHQACDTALLMMDEFGQLGLRVSGHVRMAVASGLLWVGNLGNDAQRVPTILGSTVNKVSNMIKLTNHCGAYALCGSTTYEQARSSVKARVVDCAILVGSEEELVYELRQDFPADDLGLYHDGFSSLRAREYTAACEHFRKYLVRVGRDAQVLRLLRIALALGENDDCLTVTEGGEKTVARTMRAPWLDFEALGSKVSLPDDIMEMEKLAPAAGETDSFANSGAKVGLSTSTNPRNRHVGDAEMLQTQVLQSLAVSATESGALARKFTDARGRTYHRSGRCLGRGAFGEVWLGMGSDGGMVAVKTIRMLQARRSEPRSVWTGANLLSNNPSSASAEAEEEEEGDGGGDWTISPQSDQCAPQSEVDGWTITGPATTKRNKSVGNAYQSTSCPQSDKQVQEMVQEVHLMSQLQHDNVVQFLGCAVQGQHVLICMEYLPGGSLQGVLQQFDGKLPESSVKRFTRDIVRGLEFIHQNDIVHRDLKPANVLVTIEGLCKLADFGASAELKSAAKVDESAGPVGTPMYMPPEQAGGQATSVSDIWSVGIVLCELCTGKVPWPQQQNILAFIVSLGKPDGPMPEIPDSMPARARDLAGKCIKRDPAARPSAKKLLSHPYLLT
eukprot:TRINITY_DN10529_c2_g1_i2.p1 TRINITY_DN10529_c2_g1~~TRINITY_DN10529_c2_g1_i2.p1  ORF type:complete len:1351 (+),score=407.32 TRINITY_DN10529_c2_g1_i2:82-4134(+)